MYHVYVLKSLQKNYIYVGLTNDLERRVLEHERGKERVTRFYRPFLLIYYEKYSTRIEARKREKYLKSGSGKEWIKITLLNRFGRPACRQAGAQG